jgi:protein-S-isoprenylcysteine O-methyltransferase Ste14
VKEKNGEHPFGDTGQIIFLVVFLIVWIADSFIFGKTTFLSSRIPLVIRLVICFMAIIIGVMLAKSGHRVVEGDERPDHVVRTGAFLRVRHPLYLASVLFYLGLFVSTASLAAALLWIVIALFYNYIATYEEMLLLRRFGDEYAGYMKSTGKWLPKWGK